MGARVKRGENKKMQTLRALSREEAVLYILVRGWPICVRETERRREWRGFWDARLCNLLIVETTAKEEPNK